MSYAVHTRIYFNTFDNKNVNIEKGSLITFNRFTRSGEDAIAITLGNTVYEGLDFCIEKYVTPYEDYVKKDCADYIKQMKEDNTAFRMGYNLDKQGSGIVQIQRCEGTFNTNKFIADMPRERIIDIKPMEHDTYLVLYVKEDEE